MKLKKSVMAVLAGLMGTFASSAAVVEVGGELYGNHIWNAENTYHVTSSVFLEGSLSIEPGTVVKMASGLNFDSFNRYSIHGTAEKPIIFTSVDDHSVGERIASGTGSPAKGAWGSLFLAEASYIHVKYATFGIRVTGESVENCVIESCANYGIYGSYYAENLTVRNNLISNCGNVEFGYGIYLFCYFWDMNPLSGATLCIENNTIDSRAVGAVATCMQLQVDSMPLGVSIKVHNNLFSGVGTGWFDDALMDSADTFEAFNNAYFGCTAPAVASTGRITLTVDPFDAASNPACPYLLNKTTPGGDQLIDTGYEANPSESKGMPGFFTQDGLLTDDQEIDIGYHYPHPTTVGQEGFFTKLFLLDKADDASNAVLSRSENDTRYLCVDEYGAVAGGTLSATAVDFGSGLILSELGGELLVSQGAIFGNTVSVPTLNLGGETMLESFPTPDFYLSFDELNGTTITSEGATPLTGTIGGATFDPTGHVGGSVEFDGDVDAPAIDDMIAFPADTLFAAYNFTIATWIKLDDWSPVQSIFSTLSYTYSEGGLSFAVNQDVLGLAMRYTSTDNHVVQQQVFSDEDDGVWHHIACTHSFDGSSTSIRLFVDGVPVAEELNVATPAPVYNMQPLYIGNNYDLGQPREMDGSLDELKFFTSELTPAGIAKLYADSAPSAGVLVSGGDLIMGSGNSVRLGGDSADESCAATVRQVNQAKADIIESTGPVFDYNSYDDPSCPVVAGMDVPGAPLYLRFTDEIRATHGAHRGSWLISLSSRDNTGRHMSELWYLSAKGGYLNGAASYVLKRLTDSQYPGACYLIENVREIDPDGTVTSADFSRLQLEWRVAGPGPYIYHDSIAVRVIALSEGLGSIPAPSWELVSKADSYAVTRSIAELDVTDSGDLLNAANISDVTSVPGAGESTLTTQSYVDQALQSGLDGFYTKAEVDAAIQAALENVGPFGDISMP